MGIKFRGKTTTGNPPASAIKERELEINLTDKTLFTSSDGTDIIQLGKDQGGVIHDVTVQYEIGDTVSINGVIYVVPEDPTNTGNPPPIGAVPGDPEWPDVPANKEIAGKLWNTTPAYDAGDIVTYDSGAGLDFYFAVTPVLGEAPGTVAGDWSNVISGGTY